MDSMSAKCKGEQPGRLWFNPHAAVLLTAVGALLSTATPAFSAIAYPYALPDQLNATLKVDTGSKTNFINMLLGLNTNFPENQYGSDGYNDADGQDLITTWDPPSLRFPHGVWANFYDWEVDGRRIYDGYTGTYFNAVVNVPNLRYGFPGFNTLHSTRALVGQKNLVLITGRAWW